MALAWVASNIGGPYLSRPVVTQPWRCLAWHLGSSTALAWVASTVEGLDLSHLVVAQPQHCLAYVASLGVEHHLRPLPGLLLPSKGQIDVAPQSRDLGATSSGVVHPPRPSPGWSRDLDSVFSGVA
ncbi:hypothetical protein NL676_009397 [Syzygium grande]|nr:hypothetical protein NL676_009397 [Syzygium grande]